MTSRKYKYHTINLPEVLTKKIDEVLASGSHGYTNIPDFVKASVRRHLRELEYLV
jgi:Arc/MetJ-type ribon-helix-helix transcriptional regulator